ncbi:hypothetical protein [Armatimonas sp.]|uniref:hypothetical protein n=1 Tax=Armatimonas sp. TaxID=1872638 RepID=UPI00286CE3E8|nr:hypothetical protein [Armatimonas sp.]
MKKTSFLLTSLAAATCLASATSARAITIIPSYDSAAAQQKYWTPAFKKQVQAVCDLLSGYISGSDNVTLTVTVSTTMNRNTFGTGAPNTTGAYENTNTKYRGKNGTVTFNSTFFDDTKKEWNGNNTSLMLHEIIHCLGFSSSITAFDKQIDKTNSTFTGTNTKKVNGGAVYPLNGANDLSHFKRELTPPVAKKVQLDKALVAPRMMAGGGSLLSIVDLAVLADLGYNIPTVTNATGAIALGFTLNTVFSDKSSDWKGMTFELDGYAGNDTLSVDTSDSVALFGSGGNDTLITGSEATMMCGDDMAVFDSGIDNSDIYKITSNKLHRIMEFGANDKLQLATALGITAADITNLTVESMPRKTQTDVDFINNNVPIFSYSSDTNNPSWYSARRVKIGTLTFYCYAKNSNMTNDALKERLKSNTSVKN